MNYPRSLSGLTQKCGRAKTPVYVNGVAEIYSQAGEGVFSKAVQSNCAGTIVVHLVADNTGVEYVGAGTRCRGAGEKVYTSFSLSATPPNDNSEKYERSIAFDEILEKGTSIDLSALTVWL